MRIIYLHQYFLTPDMAGGTRSYEMARRLVRAGNDVRMITTDQQAGRRDFAWRQSVEGGIEVYWANVRYDSRMGYARRLIAFVSFALRATVRAIRLPGDIIFATSTPLTIAVPALIASVWKRVPFVFEVRDMWPDVPIAIGAIRNPIIVWLARQLELVTYRRAAHIVALAPGMKEDIMRKGIDASKISVIPNGCDLDVFSSKDSGPDPRAEYDWLGSRKLILYAGAIGAINGVEYLVELASRTIAFDPEIRFLVIGRGVERELVLNRAKQLDVLNRNFYILDAMPKRELARWLNTADLIVALITGPKVIWKDAVQNKFFDALAAGKPIATNFDGWQTQVAMQADVGFIIDPLDLEAAARRVISVLSDSQWLRGLPVRARALAEGRFNRDRLADQLLSELSVVLGAER